MPETEDNKQVTPPKKEPFGGDEGRARGAAKAKYRPGLSFPQRLLNALAGIFEDDKTSTAEKLQAINLSKEILPYRKTPRRKTEKEKVVLAALKKKKPDSKPE